MDLCQILLNVDDVIPKTATCIATKTDILDRTHAISYQFEITLGIVQK